jgi:hypothetical protein
MTEPVKAADRDQILLAFHQACERPSAQDIIEWTKKYPQFAEDIRAHAAILRDWAAQGELPQQVPDDLALARARSRALNALHTARKEFAAEAEPAAVSFDAMLNAKSTNIRELARQFDIDRGTLADMIGGAMLAPVGERLVAAWTSFFAVTRAAFDNAFASALAAPRLGHAKADGPPRIIPRSYEEIIRSSASMSEARKRYWLGED